MTKEEKKEYMRKYYLTHAGKGLERKAKWNSKKEQQDYHNALAWSYNLFRMSFSEGASLNIFAYGKDDEFGYIQFSIAKSQKMYREKYMRKYNSSQGMESKYRSTLAHNSGICWICGEIHPRVIETHHLYESRSKNKHGNTLRTDFVSGICANCHRKRKVTGGETERHQIAILKAIEREWFGLGGK